MVNFKHRIKFGRGGKGSSSLAVGLGILSLLVFVLAQLLPRSQPSSLSGRMRTAAEIMERAVGVIKDCRVRAGAGLNTEDDVNGTGLIGLDYSPITTSIGSLPAKRTSTNPNFAALLVYLLHRAGVREGDYVAVGASGSFPALIVASLSACRALDAKPLPFFSLGASQWGANHPDFNWLDMWECLKGRGLFDAQPVAWSLGGGGDMGHDMDPRGREGLRASMESRGLRMITASDLQRNIAERVALLRERTDGAAIKAFINVGGSWANLGTDESILEVKPGLSRPRDIPLPAVRGMIQEMAAGGVPVIHCLFIRGLVSQFGLPWDPVPLPGPGEGGVFVMAREEHPALTFLFLGYIVATVVISLVMYRPRF